MTAPPWRAATAPRSRSSRREAAGPYPARNLGVQRASGDLIAFIDSDDAWRPGRLAAQLPLLEDGRTGLVFGDARHVGAGAGGRTCFGVTPPGRGDVAAHFAWGNFVPTVCVLVRRSCLLEAGGFPASHPFAADYVTWFRIALRHRLDFAGEVLADYAVGGAGIGADLGQAAPADLLPWSAAWVSRQARRRAGALA
jgi:glycosyltransferase involved in cell wall biosynthesis